MIILCCFYEGEFDDPPEYWKPEFFYCTHWIWFTPVNGNPVVETFVDYVMTWNPAKD